MAENKVCVEVSTVRERPQSHRIDLQNTLLPKDQGTLQKREWKARNSQMIRESERRSCPPNNVRSYTPPPTRLHRLR